MCYPESHPDPNVFTAAGDRSLAKLPEPVDRIDDLQEIADAIRPVLGQQPDRRLVAAVLACIPDLEQYARTHGSGPDARLTHLKQTLLAYGYGG